MHHTGEILPVIEASSSSLAAAAAAAGHTRSIRRTFSPRGAATKSPVRLLTTKSFRQQTSKK